MWQWQYLQHQLPTENFFKFLQWVWIFVQIGRTKETLTVKVPPMLPLPWLVSEKNVKIWNLVLTEALVINY